LSKTVGVGFLTLDGLYPLVHRADGRIPARENQLWKREHWRERDRFGTAHRFYRSVHLAEESEIQCRAGHRLRVPTAEERRRMLSRIGPGEPVYLSSAKA